MAQENGITIPIKGKGIGKLSRLYEYDPRMVREAVSVFYGVDYAWKKPVDTSDLPALPGRPPTLCPGCPHRATYYSIKQVYGPDCVYPTDIGCYTLGVLPPISMADFCICMGSSVSSSCGLSQATDQKVAAFIGDSTFFHSGITGLVNAVHNNHKFTLIILDNETTAMTGHQPHPGMDASPLGVNLPQISIEAVVRGCGVQDVHVIKPFNVKKTMEAVKASYDYDGLSVIISKEICPLYAKTAGKARKARPFTVNLEKCKKHRNCINLLACPAMFLDGDNVAIDKNQCIGCTLCAQVCTENAIAPVKA
jgi:indolepyruvate ferredoxin oxidoreductase, alpha subunit